MKLSYFELLSPDPVSIPDLGSIQSPKLRDISLLGYPVYQSYLAVLLIDLKEYFTMAGCSEQYESLSEEEKTQLDLFELLTANAQTLALLQDMLNFFIREDVLYSPKHNGFIVITASHNPPEYNGYKCYWEDGAQVAAPRDQEIITEVNNVTDYHDVKTMEKQEAVKAGLYQVIGREIDDKYMAELKKQIIHPEIIAEVADDIKIVYSPFNGTGNLPVRRILDEIGFKNVYVVPEQEMPDPNFTTLAYPNPEDPKAFTLALELAKERKADIVLATDPDADRLGIYALDTKSGEYIPFTGNMSGMLIAEYILRERTATGKMPENPALVTTIVTTNMARAITEDYKVKCIEVLTGFKYIGEQIKLFEQTGSDNYVFGLEESYGCLAGTHARDKDAIVAVMCLCEMAAWCKKNGKTVWDQMITLYEKYGYFKESQYSITMKGIDGAKEIEELMNKLRSNPPRNFGGLKVKEFRDYTTGKTLNLESGEEGETGLPKSNVLYFDLTNDSWCCARPSGTEPKIKFYMGVKGNSLEDAEAKLQQLTEDLKAYL